MVENHTNATSNSVVIIDEDPENAVLFCGVMLVCLIIGVIGHITVLLSVIYYEELQRPLNVLIVNLSISQFFTLIIPVFGDVIVMLSQSSYTNDFNNSSVLCFFSLLFSTSTSIFYGFIALNRLLSTVLETFYARWSWTLSWTLVLLGWIVAGVGSAFPWYTGDVTFSRDGYFILGYPWFSPSINHFSGLNWFLMMVYFYLPTICVVGIYVAVIVYSVKSQRLIGLALNSPRAITLRDRFRVLLMLLTTNIIFIIFYYTSYIYWNSGRRTRSANYFFLWLMFSHNVFNPYIFGLIQPQFREAYIRLIFWILRKWRCWNSYGDSRRVFPTIPTSAENLRLPPTVIFNAAKNDVIFHQTPKNDAIFHQTPSAIANGPCSTTNHVSETLRAPIALDNQPMRSIEVSAVSRTSEA